MVSHTQNSPDELPPACPAHQHPCSVPYPAQGVASASDKSNIGASPLERRDTHADDGASIEQQELWPAETPARQVGGEPTNGDRLDDIALPLSCRDLRELDPHVFSFKAELRHDLNFEAETEFRPNVDTPEGRARLRRADKYWDLFCEALVTYTASANAQSVGGKPDAARRNKLARSKKWLSAMFESIQDIMKAVLSEQDHSRVERLVDVPKLMEELEHGVCDMLRLSESVVHLLKEHCAPTRDYSADRIVALTKAGVEQGSLKSFVRALRELMGVLEAIKLDAANHYLGHARPLLLLDSINFEKRYQLERIAHGHMDVAAAREWYLSALRRTAQTSVETATPTPLSPFARQTDFRFRIDVFARAAVPLLFFDDDRGQFPATFYLDHRRLHGLKSRIHDVVRLELCCQLFHDILSTELRCSATPSRNALEALRHSLSVIVAGDEWAAAMRHGPPQRDAAMWLANNDQLASEIVRHALRANGCRLEYNYVLSRTTAAALRSVLGKPISCYAGAMKAYLTPQIVACVHQYTLCSSFELFDRLVCREDAVLPPPTAALRVSPLHATPPAGLHESLRMSSSQAPPSPRLPHPDLSSIVRRFTHILLLHWHIWGSIAYVHGPAVLSTSGSACPG